MNPDEYALTVCQILKNLGYSTVDVMTFLKTAYLLERIYYQKTGRRLTSLSYYNYTYGPFNGILLEELEKLPSTGEDYTYSLENVTFKVELPTDIIEDLREILLKFNCSFELVAYVTNLPEVKNTPFGKEIPFTR